MRLGILVGTTLLAMQGLAAAAPKTYTLALGGTEASPTPPPGVSPPSTLIEPEGFKLTVTCSAPLDCTKVQLSRALDEQHPMPAAPADKGGTSTSVTFTVAAEDALIKLFYGTVKGALWQSTLHLAPPKPGEEKPPEVPPAIVPSTLRDLATTPCQRMELAPTARQVFVTPLGSPLTPLPRHFAETDTLTVTVVGNPALLDALSVVRKSSIRVITGVNVLGENERLPETLRAQAQHATTCTTKSFSVDNFAAGTGEVEIRATLGADPVSLGAFQLIVDPVFLGMFSIGTVWTPLVSPSFGVALREGEQVITRSETGDRRMAYAFLFTPFLWDGLERDVRRPMTLSKFYHHINPSLGFLLNDPLDNVVVGATLDVQSTVLFTWGMLFSHVTELDGVSVGSAFAGEASALPVHKRWKHDWFVGVSVDLRVGVKLLRAVLGTAGAN